MFPHRIIIYMHVKEFGRGSNTSSLCQVALPQSSKVLVASVPEDEKELARELSVRPHETVVLYPSADSITVSWPPLQLASASIAR
jgi:DTW domain-containing protein YfiP